MSFRKIKRENILYILEMFSCLKGVKRVRHNSLLTSLNTNSKDLMWCGIKDMSLDASSHKFKALLQNA